MNPFSGESGFRANPAVRPPTVSACAGENVRTDLIAPGPDGLEAAATAAATALFERVQSALAAPFAIGQAEFQIEASAGVALFPVDASDSEALHKHADAAMYVAKASGSGISVYDRASTADPLAPLSAAVGLRRALERGELELHYQPIVRLADARTLGIEALIRWRDPARGLVAPGEFLPIAEQTGMMDEIGEFVLVELCRQAQRWLADGLAPNLGINVSPRQLRVRGFAERFAQHVHEHGLSPNRFVVELTESAWTVEGSRMRPALDELRAQGFALAIDDFGAGYSSLSRLLELPVDVIKIDRAFLSSIPGDCQAVAIVTAIMQLAEACGCDVVAEGVENAAQREFLFDQGCSLGQGFGLGRPVTEAEITPILHRTLVDDRRSRGTFVLPARAS